MMSYMFTGLGYLVFLVLLGLTAFALLSLIMVFREMLAFPKSEQYKKLDEAGAMIAGMKFFAGGFVLMIFTSIGVASTIAYGKWFWS